MALERYTPENPNTSTLEDLAAYVERELQRISNAFVQEQEEADELHVPPDRPQNGGRYLADGIDWDPGSGRGWYWYDAVNAVFRAFEEPARALIEFEVSTFLKGAAVIIHGGTAFFTIASALQAKAAEIVRGSNSNGEYVKFPDGTMLCIHAVAATSASSYTWTFPAVFKSGTVPTQHYLSAGQSGADYSNYSAVTIAENNVSWTFNKSKDGIAHSVSVSFRLLAVGSWY